MADDRRRDEPRPGDPAEGVRIIGADEAAEAIERGDVAERRGDRLPRYGDRPARPPVGPKPALRFPLGASADPDVASVRPAKGVRFDPRPAPAWDEPELPIEDADDDPWPSEDTWGVPVGGWDEPQNDVVAWTRGQTGSHAVTGEAPEEELAWAQGFADDEDDSWDGTWDEPTGAIAWADDEVVASTEAAGGASGPPTGDPVDDEWAAFGTEGEVGDDPDEGRGEPTGWRRRLFSRRHLEPSAPAELPIEGELDAAPQPPVEEWADEVDWSQVDEPTATVEPAVAPVPPGPSAGSEPPEPEPDLDLTETGQNPSRAPEEEEAFAFDDLWGPPSEEAPVVESHPPGELPDPDLPAGELPGSRQLRELLGLEGERPDRPHPEPDLVDSEPVLADSDADVPGDADLADPEADLPGDADLADPEDDLPGPDADVTKAEADLGVAEAGASEEGPADAPARAEPGAERDPLFDESGGWAESKVFDFADDPSGQVELPHWTDPPTGELPPVMADEGDEDPRPSSGSTPAVSWQAHDARWGNEGFDDLVEEDEAPMGALDDDRPHHDDVFDFDELDPVEEPPPPPRDPHRTPPPRPVPEAPAGSGGAGRNVGVALAVGVGFAAVALIAFALGPAVAMVLVTAILFVCVVEFQNAARRAGYRPAVAVGLAASLLVPWAVYAKGLEAFPIVAVLTVATVLAWHLVGADGDARVVESAGVTLFGIAWIVGLGSFAALALSLPDGVGMLLTAVLAAVAYDVGGYAVGRSMGRRGLSDASPNKTVEGLFGGVLVSLVVVFIVGLVGLAPFDSPGAALKIGLFAALAAPLGDLCESLVKRDLGVKDMGSMLPEHGGLLDRFDGLLFVLPAVYYGAVFFSLGPFA